MLVAVALATPNLASAFQGPPLYKNDLNCSMPVNNGIPAKHDPSLPTDNDNPSSGSCSSGSNTVPEISDAAVMQDTGDPVGLHNGMVSYRATDLFIPGRKLHLEFTRRYNSMFSTVLGPLGYGWDHSFNIFLQSSDDRRDVRLFNGNTRRDQYTSASSPSSGQALESPPGIYNRLFWSVPPGGTVDTFWTRGRHGTKTVFEYSHSITTSTGTVSIYVVKWIEDSNENRISFEYDATSKKLIKVHDTYGRVVELIYQTSSPFLLDKVKDYTGREIQFSYSTSNDLTSVRTPTTTPVTENGVVFNNFPTGRTETYTYASGFGDGRDHNLLTVTRPGDTTPAVSFLYYGPGDPNGFTDWCQSQTLGGTQGTYTAGGTIHYSYSTASPLAGVLRTTVRDRRGNETDYYFGTTGHALRIDERSGTTSTILATTQLQYDPDGQVTRIDRPLGNYETRTYATGAGLPGPILRYVQGNLASVSLHADARGTGGTSSSTITRTFAWEPIFNHLCLRTDELGRSTEFVCDYMEGNPTLTTPLIAAELGLSTADAGQIANLAGLLKGADQNGDQAVDQMDGNVVQILYPTATLSSTGSASIGQISREPNAQQEAVETFVYNAYGQMIARTDAEQNTTVFLYYPATMPFNGTTSSGTSTDNVTGGYLKQVDADVLLPYTASAQLTGVNPRAHASDIGRNTNQNPSPVTAKVDYVYDAVGNILSITDPRGVATQLSVNELNEVWKVIRGADVSAASTRSGGINGSSENLTGQAFGFERKFVFDAQGRPILALEENSGNNSDTGTVAGYLETTIAYDLLSDVRQVAQEFGTLGETSTWQYTYDANQNPVDVIQPMGNVTHHTWDARDQLIKVQKGFTASPPSALETIEFAYDANGNRVEVEDGLNHVTQFTLDGFDRVHFIQDALANKREFSRNAASLVDWIRDEGALHGTSGPGFNLRRTYFEYDEQQRLTLTSVEDPQSALVDGALTQADGKVSRRIDYDRLGRVTFHIEDDLGVHETRYDGMGRVLKAMQPDVGADGTANTIDAHHDDNGNLVKVVETEEYPTGSTNPTRVFESFHVYDALDRGVSTTDNLGHTVRWSFDSRDNVVLSTDAKGPYTGLSINGRAANDPGNATRYFHDGLNRLVTTEMDLNVGGVSNGGLDLTNPYNLDGKVTLTQKWDLNSRLIEQIDDRRKGTKYEYDLANRMTLLRYADNSSTIDYVHDAVGNVTQITDARGNVTSMLYDNLNRLTTVDVVLAAQTVGTTKQRFEYDGLGRRTKEVDSVDANLGNGNDAEVVRTFDALSRIKADMQNGRTVTSAWKEEGKRTTLTYSSSSNPLTVTYAHDVLDRISTISTAGTQVADYTYAGPERLLKRTLTVTATKSLIEKRYAGAFDDTLYWDGARRPTRMETTNRIGTVTYSQFEHEFDGNYNRKFERRVHDASQGDNYVYDSVDRLVRLERQLPAADVGSPGSTNAQTTKDYQLDGVQNWRKVTTNGVATTLAVSAVNAYTSIVTGGITEQPVHDADGNMTSPHGLGSPLITLKYDFQDRLREITNGTDSVFHDYDASGRRIRTYTSGSVPGCPPWVEYVHDGWDVIEEFDESNNLMRRFVMGNELDEPLRMDTFSFWPALGTYYFHRSTLGHVVALSNSTGAVVERYTFDANGSPQFEDAANSPKAVTYSDYGNPYLFTGRRYEPWIRSLYEFRYRFHDPAMGRFIQRDPVGVWTDQSAFGNGHSYVGLSPTNLTDPLGLGPAKVIVVLMKSVNGARGKINFVAGKSISVDDAIKIRNDMGNIGIRGGTHRQRLQLGKKIEKQVGDGDILVHEGGSAGHPPNGWDHLQQVSRQHKGHTFLLSLLSPLRFEHDFPTIGPYLDPINPLSTPYDIVELYGLIAISPNEPVPLEPGSGSGSGSTPALNDRSTRVECSGPDQRRRDPLKPDSRFPGMPLDRSERLARLLQE